MTILLQATATSAQGIAAIGAGLAIIGAGLTIIGAAFGISKIGASALESIARQPEATNDIRMSMIIAAALIEGATLFALIVCFVAVNNLS